MFDRRKCMGKVITVMFFSRYIVKVEKEIAAHRLTDKFLL